MVYKYVNKELDDILAQFKTEPIFDEKLLEFEYKNAEMFARHQDLVIGHSFIHQPELYVLAFNEAISGTGVLDVGSGRAGVFASDYLSSRYAKPHVGCDIFFANVPEGWESKIIPGQTILETFGESSFDHVQCMETLEHVPTGVDLDIAAQMIKVCRKTCLITCCGLGHHLGQHELTLVTENPDMPYKGQPSIEGLMDLGYQVRLVGNYQIIAWYKK